ncbi:MAG: hypothetical protein F4Z96_01910 [Chloroflexi bacterium]|nr:hypothetical protein [Chloroflexota bacterium]
MTDPTIIRVGAALLDSDGETIPELVGERTFPATDSGYDAAYDHAETLAETHSLDSGLIHGPYSHGHYGAQHPTTGGCPAVVIETLTGDDAAAVS